MKKLTHSAAARTAAFILCLLCGLTAVLGAAGYFFTKINRDNTLPEPDGVLVYRETIHRLLLDAVNQKYYTGEYPDLPSGYSYTVTEYSVKTDKETVLFDSRTKNALPLGVSFSMEQNGRLTEAQAYLEPTQTPGEELSQLRSSVNTLLRFQNAYLPVGIAAAVLCLALFLFLMASMGKTPDGVKLRGIHRVPLDLFLAAAVLAAVLTENFCSVWSVNTLLYDPLWTWVLPGALVALWLGFAALLTCCTVSARLRAGKWWRNTVV